MSKLQTLIKNLPKPAIRYLNFKCFISVKSMTINRNIEKSCGRLTQCLHSQTKVRNEVVSGVRNFMYKCIYTFFVHAWALVTEERFQLYWNEWNDITGGNFKCNIPNETVLWLIKKNIRTIITLLDHQNMWILINSY